MIALTKIIKELYANCFSITRDKSAINKSFSQIKILNNRILNNRKGHCERRVLNQFGINFNLLKIHGKSHKRYDADH